ncbi:MAG: hypothetical protein Ta2G_13290 [Termitinemataceae bacterium]|nr:MAG: hypothetical protein Ta2G_13290 [Termitinemataceae bacterium]
MKTKVRIILIFAICCVFFACSKKQIDWKSVDSPQLLSGDWEGSDTVLIPKSKFTLSENTSVDVTIAASCDIDKERVIYATKFDFSNFLKSAKKEKAFNGKTEQQIWDDLKQNWTAGDDVVLDKFSVTVRGLTDVDTFGMEWEPVLSDDEKKLRVLYDLSYMLSVGRGTYFTLNKTAKSKLLAVFKEMPDTDIEQSEDAAQEQEILQDEALEADAATFPQR